MTEQVVQIIIIIRLDDESREVEQEKQNNTVDQCVIVDTLGGSSYNPPLLSLVAQWQSGRLLTARFEVRVLAGELRKNLWISRDFLSKRVL